MLLTDAQIRQEIENGAFTLEPFSDFCLQPASYDLRVGDSAFTSSSREKVPLSRTGMIRIEPGEFAVVETLERVSFGNQMAAQLGLRSEYARKGLLMLSGPQVDPGFKGVLIVRLINLAPIPIVLPHKEPFLTTQFFRLHEPVSEPYAGPYQDQHGISARDIQELTQTEGLTLGEVIKTLSALARDVAELRGSVSRLSWLVPLIIGIGMAVVAITVALK
jgi:dCTP deaminase